MNPENTDAYIYLATAIILSMLASLTGTGAVILVCTIPALLIAKDVCTVNCHIVYTYIICFSIYNYVTACQYTLLIINNLDLM